MTPPRVASGKKPKVSPTRQQNIGGIVRHQNTPESSSRPKGQRPAGGTIRETVSTGKRRIKGARSEAKAVGRASRQTVKAAGSPRQTIQAGACSAKTAQQTVRAAAQAQQRAVQATGAAKWTVSKPVT